MRFYSTIIVYSCIAVGLDRLLGQQSIKIVSDDADFAEGSGSIEITEARWGSTGTIYTEVDIEESIWLEDGYYDDEPEITGQNERLNDDFFEPAVVQPKLSGGQPMTFSTLVILMSVFIMYLLK